MSTPPAARVLCVPELFEPVILACDWNARVALREALLVASDDPRWCSDEQIRNALRDVVDASHNQPNCRNAHLVIDYGYYPKRLYERKFVPRPIESEIDDNDDDTSVLSDSDDVEEVPIGHEQVRQARAIEVIDLFSHTQGGFENIVWDVLPNVVRLIAEEDYRNACLSSSDSSSNASNSSEYPDGCNHRFFYYPDCMPRARCVVAFACPKDDVADCPQRRKVQVLSDTEWVFDRAVYHPLSCSANCGFSCGAGPTIPHLPPAWHTLFLVPPQNGFAKFKDRLLDPIAHVAAIALQRRKRLPGAHVTIVFNPPPSRRTRKNPKRSRLPSAEDRFRDAVTAHLTKKRSNDEAFVAGALAAFKCVSWAVYQSSITPRQFELETIIHPHTTD